MIFRALTEPLRLAAVGGLCLAMGFGAGNLLGRVQASANAKANAALEALDRIEQLGERNADFLALSDRDRCLVFMRDSGLPDDLCDER